MKKEELLKLFDKLTEYTYIYGYEDELMDIINPILPKPLSRDEYGNYYIEIGKSKSLFTCHLDTVGQEKTKINKIYYTKKGVNFVKTDGTTILGADDKTGMVIMLNMINNNVPGLYYFLIGEEKGTVGSGLLYTHKSQMLLSKYDRAIAFDRRGYGSIINRQKGQFCSSPEFVDALSKELSSEGMRFKADPTGVNTDSALFMGVISEVTNLSVGYFNEHRTTEYQDLDYMIKLANAAVNINWEGLPVVRKPVSFDSSDPEFVKEEPNHLPEYKLLDIFDEVYEIAYSVGGYMPKNRSFFKPEKEMLFFQKSDYESVEDFSLIVHWNGSLTFKKDKIITNVDDIEILKVMYEEGFIEDILLFDKSYTFKYKDDEIVYFIKESNSFISKFDKYR